MKLGLKKTIHFILFIATVFVSTVFAESPKNQQNIKNNNKKQVKVEILLSSDSDIYLEGLGGIQSVLKFAKKCYLLNIFGT